MGGDLVYARCCTREHWGQRRVGRGNFRFILDEGDNALICGGEESRFHHCNVVYLWRIGPNFCVKAVKYGAIEIKK